jgi:translation initiation factor 3 subunit F
MLEAGKVGFDILKSTIVEKLPNDLEGMESSMEKLYVLIDEIYKYVDDVVVRTFWGKILLFLM